MSRDPEDIAATYYTAWKGKDFDTLASLLADEVTFQGRSARRRTAPSASRA